MVGGSIRTFVVLVPAIKENPSCYHKEKRMVSEPREGYAARVSIYDVSVSN